jgi:glyoxylase-like metal-dependent hydrolase (beta-lactamase superfamily II)
MIFRQLFDRVSCAYTYLVASGGEACLIDPVLDQVEQYVRLLRELDLSLVKAIDTHLHADHITGLGVLQQRTHCLTIMGDQTAAEVVSLRVRDGERIRLNGTELQALYTPGHTDDSYCFLMDGCLFTGDTLLIRGTGRTDFQNGNAAMQYDSIFNRLLKLPDDTRVYPGHDYNGQTVSTIGEERAHNPRLQVGSAAAYVEMMEGLGLPRPKMMDIAVPANRQLGLSAASIALAGREAR